MIKKLGEYRNNFLSTIYGKLSEFKTCEKLIKKHLPEKLLPYCNVTDIRNSTIFITVANAGMLSLLRYEKPNLLKKLRTEEKMHALRAIELKLDSPHLRTISNLPTPKKSPTYSEKSCDSVHTAAEHCLNPKLKQALKKLEHTLRGKI